MQINIITKQNRIDALEAALKVAEDQNLAKTSLIVYGTAGVVGTVLVGKITKAVADNVRDSYASRKALRKSAKVAATITADDIAEALVKAQAAFEAQQQLNTATN